MIPVVFENCSGWFHPAAGGRGVVICNPHGYEELCVHRPLIKLADGLAEAGLPTLRFDYHGTGDSAGDDEDPARVRAWLDSIAHAVAWMRRETGVTEVAILGLRLGATLAATAAREIGDVARLVLLAPCTSGNAYVREARAFSLFSAPQGGVPAPRPEWAGDLEATGYVLTATTLADLAGLDLLKLDAPPAPDVLLLHRPDIVPHARLAARLRGLDCRVEEGIMDGYVGLMDEAMEDQRVPAATFARIAAWLATDMPASSARTALPAPASIVQTRSTETTVRFGDRDLVGVHCRPAGDSDDSAPAILFLNTGSHHHVGFGRMSVMLARRLARRGIVSLRMDAAGIGDSPVAPGKPENALYSLDACDDVVAALDWLQARGVQRVVTVGFCSGAYVSLHSALRDARIVGQVMVNAQAFVWRDGDTIERVIRTRKASAGHVASEVTDALRRPDKWRRLLTGDTKAWGIARGVAGRAGTLAARRAAAFTDLVFGTRLARGEVARMFERIDNRGTHTLLVYSAGDDGLHEVDVHLGPGAESVAWLQRSRLQIIEGADHLLTARASRARWKPMSTAWVGPADCRRRPAGPRSRRPCGWPPSSVPAGSD